VEFAPKPRGTGRPFQKGNPGRPKGTVNKRFLEIRDLARRMLTDPEYLELLARRLKVGQAPHMEKFFAEHLWGKPKENIDVTGLNLTALQLVLLESRNGANGHDTDAIEIEADQIAVEQVESKNGNGDGHE
jgi:hypothetical protein